MSVKKLFGGNLKKYRKQCGFTQEELSEKIGISVNHLSLIENGATFVSAEVIEKLSDVLQIPIASFFYNEEENFGSDTFLQKMDTVLEAELHSAMKNIKSKMRE